MNKPPFAYTKPKRDDKWRARDVIIFLDWPDCAKRVCSMLVDRCNKATGQCDPAEGRMQHDCELSRRAYWKAIKFLCDAEIIDRKQDGRDNDNPMTKTDWRRNSYAINWAKLNELHAERNAYRKGYRRGSKPKNTCTSVHASPKKRARACTQSPSETCTSVHANLKRENLKRKDFNLESAFGADGDDDLKFWDGEDDPPCGAGDNDEHRPNNDPRTGYVSPTFKLLHQDERGALASGIDDTERERMMVYRARPIKRRTKAEVEQLDAQMLNNGEGHA